MERAFLLFSSMLATKLLIETWRSKKIEAGKRSDKNDKIERQTFDIS